MAVTIRDFFTFPFNSGRGIRAAQVEGVFPAAQLDPSVVGAVDDLKEGRLGFTWRFGLGFRNQSFDDADFLSLVTGASSEYPELQTPEFAEEDTWFSKIATPLDAPEAEIVFGGAYFQNDILSVAGSTSYRRFREPGYINGVPHRIYVSRLYARPWNYSDVELRLTPRLRQSRYPRYATLSAFGSPPGFSGDWSKSYSPVIPLGAFPGGANQYAHVLLPHGVAPEPTLIARAAAGSANIAAMFTRASSLEMVGNVPHAVYSSDAPLDAATYSGQDLVVLPERDGIRYYEPPTAFPNDDLGFTWYSGFYSRPSGGPGALLARPILDDLVGNTDGNNLQIEVSHVQGTTRQLVLPDNNDGGAFAPTGTGNRFAVRFLVVPANVVPTGLLTVPLITYEPLATFGEPFDHNWSRQWGPATDPNFPAPTQITIGGVAHHVWIESAGGRLSTGELGGARVHLLT